MRHTTRVNRRTGSLTDYLKSTVVVLFCLSALSAMEVSAHDLRESVAPFIHEFCIHCHDADTNTRLNFKDLNDDLADPEVFRQWEHIHDQITAGKMPPNSEAQPTAKAIQAALAAMKRNLKSANNATMRKYGRVPARRLTRVEYEHTLRDLLSIDGDFAKFLPEESDAGSFDTVGSAQHISALHLESYLAAADRALATAIRLHKNPYRSHQFDLLGSQHLNAFHERELRIGGNISRKLEDGVAVFRDVDYLLRSDLHAFRLRSSGSGKYRINVTAEAFQSADPVAMKVVVKDVSGHSELVAAFDLMPGETHSCQVNTWLDRTRVFYVGLVEEQPSAQILADIYDAGGATKYQGPGIAVKSIRVEGPLTGGWPPKSTREILVGVNLSAEPEGVYAVELSESPLTHVKKVISHFAPKAFRRPLSDTELEAFVNLAKPAIANGKDFVDVLRIPLRAILTSPQLLLLTGPSGQLNDYQLASRLSYFFWKSVPDEELLAHAERGTLGDSRVLRSQVDRLLDDDRSKRFIRDFLDQSLRLQEINATTPDEKLYPEYDEVLHWSIPQETESFFTELIRKDLSVSNLIDSDFTFLNRRLATHYGIDNVRGQSFRKVELPKDSPRGGLLAQASILKVTANGLVTSPVSRGDFVLSDFLGTPPPPPPANVGTIEPDISGASTIRETLTKHRDVEACAKCHQKIDPPGFALECFDPIGGFRTHYRASADDFLTLVAYTDGPAVDSSGVTADGRKFSGIQEFRSQLLQQQDQLARHLISQLVVYSTGGEIQFTDRDEIDAIFESTREGDFPIRTIIHEIVQSKLFRNR